MREWISVEDRLPEPMETVFIKEKWIEEIQIGWHLKGKWVEQHENHVCNGDAWCTHEINDVEYWLPMELSEPPKERG